MYLKSKKEDIVLTDLDVEEPNITQFLKGDLKNEYLCNKFVPQWEEKQLHLMWTLFRNL